MTCGGHKHIRWDADHTILYIIYHCVHIHLKFVYMLRYRLGSLISLNYDSSLACKHRHISRCHFSLEKVTVKVATRVTPEVVVLVALNKWCVSPIGHCNDTPYTNFMGSVCCQLVGSSSSSRRNFYFSLSITPTFYLMQFP